MSPTIISYTNSEEKKTHNIEEMDKFTNTVISSQKVLYSAKSVFPFDFFPDEIIIDENKVDLIYGQFFYTREVFSIPIKNINSARSYVSLIFGEIKIELEGYNTNPEPIKFLWNSDAVKVRRIINGLVTLSKRNINLADISLLELKEKVEQIGKATEHVKST